LHAERGADETKKETRTRSLRRNQREQGQELIRLKKQGERSGLSLAQKDGRKSIGRQKEKHLEGKTMSDRTERRY